MCSLRFENNLLIIEGVGFEENTIIEAFVCFRFASFAITNTALGFYRIHLDIFYLWIWNSTVELDFEDKQSLKQGHQTKLLH